MSNPIQGEPWLVAHARTLLPPTQRGPQSPFAPADASAVRPIPAPTTLAQKLHMLRMTAGGGAEGVARLPTDAVAMAALPIMAAPAQGSLHTVGRGEVRPSNLPSMASVLQPPVQRVLDAGEGAARSIGDFVGGTPQTSSEQDFRDIGSLAGNLVAWERLPALLRGNRAMPLEIDLDVLAGREPPPPSKVGRITKELPRSTRVPSEVAYRDFVPRPLPVNHFERLRAKYPLGGQ